MRRLWFSVGCASVLGACQWIPGTDQYAIAKGEEVASELLIDPTSAMFRNSAVFEVQNDKGEKHTAVCGEINGKNRNGAYAGYTRYIAVVELKQGELEPTPLMSKEEAERLGDQCRREANGPFYFETQRDLARMTCEQAKDAAEERLQLAAFELDWQSMCGTKDKPHLPNLNTSTPADKPAG